MTVRRARPEDVPAMVAIDTRAGPFPWRPGRLEQTFANLQGIQGLVVEDVSEEGLPGKGAVARKTIQGFILYHCVLDEGSVLNIAVSRERQGQGLARDLLHNALASMRAQGMRRCLLEVRRSNKPACALYRGAGFVEDGVRRNYYPDGARREDALLMSVAL